VTDSFRPQRLSSVVARWPLVGLADGGELGTNIVGAAAELDVVFFCRETRQKETQ
jgi:hypothetical protein